MMHRLNSTMLKAPNYSQPQVASCAVIAQTRLAEPAPRHPDFFDAFWASNRGSMSKASPVLNLSEDIFAGFNVLMRRWTRMNPT